ncbi:hypothetical protein C2845_PM10G15370 [Panicum miliaceum]|uniref:Uncharacterized protein n=1 Tax=Panicum miliaceum TaxID=4540 RepID=A0A3L6PE51_PANMI|nr:hypothetical protein C2845_PM10G15370 [Panicum miliaceum]
MGLQDDAPNGENDALGCHRHRHQQEHRPGFRPENPIPSCTLTAQHARTAAMEALLGRRRRRASSRRGHLAPSHCLLPAAPPPRTLARSSQRASATPTRLRGLRFASSSPCSLLAPVATVAQPHCTTRGPPSRRHPPRAARGLHTPCRGCRRARSPCPAPRPPLCLPLGRRRHRAAPPVACWRGSGAADPVARRPDPPTAGPDPLHRCSNVPPGHGHLAPSRPSARGPHWPSCPVVTFLAGRRASGGPLGRRRGREGRRRGLEAVARESPRSLCGSDTGG